MVSRNDEKEGGSVRSLHTPRSLRSINQHTVTRGQSLDLERQTSTTTLDPPRSFRSLDLARQQSRSRAEERATSRSGRLARRSSLTRHANVLGHVDAVPSALHRYPSAHERQSPRPSFTNGAERKSGEHEHIEEKSSVEHVENGKEISDTMTGEGEGDDLVALQVTDTGEEIVYPDGGLQAWLVVVGGFAASIGGFGLTASVGAFQSYYEKNLLSKHSSSEISWIGSAMAALTFGTSVFTGPLVDRLGCKILLSAGTVIVSLAALLLSFCKEYYQVFICQGVLMAAGMNLLFITPMGIVGQWFFLRRGLAFGIIMTGSSVGALVWPTIIANLPSKIGFAWTVRVIALMLFVLGIVATLLMKARLPPRPPGPYFCWSEFRNPAYALVAASNPFYVFAYFSFLTFIGTYGRIYGLGTLAPYLLIIVNGASGVGRLSAGFLADIMGTFNMVVICLASQTILMFAWLAMKTPGAVIVFCILFGMISGAPISLQGPLITSTAKDPRLAGTLMGQAMMIQSFAQLAGPPIVGAILGKGTDEQMARRFPGAIGLAGAMLTINFVGMVGARLCKSRKLKALV